MLDFNMEKFYGYKIDIKNCISLLDKIYDFQDFKVEEYKKELNELVDGKFIKIINFDKFSPLQSINFCFNDQWVKSYYKAYKISEWDGGRFFDFEFKNLDEDFKCSIDETCYRLLWQTERLDVLKEKIVEWMNFKLNFEKEFLVKKDLPIYHSTKYNYNLPHKSFSFMVKDINEEKLEKIKRYFSYIVCPYHIGDSYIKKKRKIFDDLKDGKYVVYYDTGSIPYILVPFSEMIERKKFSIQSQYDIIEKKKKVVVEQEKELEQLFLY